VVRSRRQLALWALFGAITLVTVSACGARLSPHQRSLAIQQGGGGTGVGGQQQSSTGTTGPTTGTGTTGTGTTGTGATGSSGTTGSKGTTSTTTTTGGGSSGTNAYACSTNSSNNGGKTDVGLTADTINLANISDISGPVPGLFKSASDAAQAFANYFNATYPNGLCGRKLALHRMDSKTDSTTDKTTTQDACKNDFAIVGSQSAFDDGGASAINSCHIVDIPAAAVTAARQASPYTYAALSTDEHDISDAGPKWFEQTTSRFGSGSSNVSQHAAFLYINAGASAENGKHDIAAYQKAGFKFAYTAAIPIQSATTQGFKPYVQKMKSAKVTFVQWLGAYQEAASLAQAMSQSSFSPKAFLLDPTGYTPAYAQQAGSAGNGTYIYSPTEPLDASQSEMQLYAQWLQRSGISDPPTFFGQCAWSAMRLFVDQAVKVGGHLTRATMINNLKKVDNWTGDGLTSKQHVGAKTTGPCVLFLQLQGTRFSKVAPSGDGYLCGNLIHT
jgi:hypothetical protein